MCVFLRLQTIGRCARTVQQTQQKYFANVTIRISMQLNYHGFKGERQSVFTVLFHSQTTFVGFFAHSSLRNGQISFYYLASHYEEGNTRIELHITMANYHAKRY